MHEIRIALRTLGRRPGFTLIALITLALGIGANAAIFSVVDAVLLRPLPFRDPDRVVIPWEFSEEVQRRVGFDRLPSSPGDVTDFITKNRTFAQLSSMRAERVNLTGNGDPERIGGIRVSRNFLDAVGVQPVQGRSFIDSDVGGPRTILMSYGLWQRRYGGSTDVVGGAILINGEPATVVGVLRPGSTSRRRGRCRRGSAIPRFPKSGRSTTSRRSNSGAGAARASRLIGRLAEGVTLQAAQADLAGIAADIAVESPASNAGWTVRVMPLREQLVGSVRRPLLVLLTAVGFVLLIACANVANLLLVRAASRQREVSVRYALGAERRQILRQLLIESLVLALGAGALGVFLGWLGLRVLLVSLPVDLPSLSAATLDWRVLIFTVLMSTITGIVFGLAPALTAARTDLVDGLRDGGRGSTSSRRAHRTRNSLVVVEVALAAMLLIGASLLIQAFVRLLRVDTGFRAEGVLTMDVALPRSTYSGPRAAEFFDRLVERLSVVPGIDAAAAASSIPLAGGENLRQVTIDGRPKPDSGKEIITDYRIVTPGYFQTMAIPLISGELLPAQRGPASTPVLLINSMMAEAYFPGENAIGRRMKLTAFDQPGPWFTIIGVVGDTKHTALDSPLRPQVYVHQHADPSCR